MPQFDSQEDKLGFTNVEIAQFLGRELNADSKGNSKKMLSVMHENDLSPTTYSLKAFKNIFGVSYLFHLRFADYKAFEFTVKNCPLLLRTPLGNQQRQLAERFSQELSAGYICPGTIRWVGKGIGYGFFTDKDIAEGEYIGEYTGNVRKINRALPELNDYCFHYPTRFSSFHALIVDALRAGNELRFLNHSANPNLYPVCLLNRNILHTCFLAKKAVPAGTELTFNYGSAFWQTRVMTRAARDDTPLTGNL